jgi:hypothetical protein
VDHCNRYALLGWCCTGCDFDWFVAGDIGKAFHIKIHHGSERIFFRCHADSVGCIGVETVHDRWLALANRSCSSGSRIFSSCTIPASFKASMTSRCSIVVNAHDTKRRNAFLLLVSAVVSCAHIGGHREPLHCLRFVYDKFCEDSFPYSTCAQSTSHSGNTLAKVLFH